jgi:hypothetical protein
LWNLAAPRRKVVVLKAANAKPRHWRKLLFEQFKENLTLARQTTETAREGLRSAQSAWRKATPMKREVWLLVPTVIVVSAVSEHFSVRWYYEAAAMLMLVVLESWMLRRKLQ